MGAASEVAFDLGTESKHVISHVSPEGDGFRILGAGFDCRLVMGEAVREVVTDISWKLRTVLRSRRFHTVQDMVDLYKSRVVSYVEYRTVALYHASDSVLKPLGDSHRRFLHDIGMNELTALNAFHLAPLGCRRDMAMLGMTHRSAMGKSPLQLQNSFRRIAMPLYDFQAGEATDTACI